MKRPPREHRQLHFPETLRIEFQTDQEHHEHDPELGEIHDRLDFFHEAETIGTYHDTGEQVPDHGAETNPGHDRNEDHSGDQRERYTRRDGVCRGKERRGVRQEPAPEFKELRPGEFNHGRTPSQRCGQRANR